MFCNNVPAGKSDKILSKFNKINFSALPQGFFRHFRLYPQFRGNAEKSPFLVFLAPAPRRKKISGNCLMCLKDNCQGFQKPRLEIMPGVSLPIFFMPELKSFGVAPTSPIEKITAIERILRKIFTKNIRGGQNLPPFPVRVLKALGSLSFQQDGSTPYAGKNVTGCDFHWTNRGHARGRQK